MGGWLQSVSPWHWLVLGVVLVILEIFSPGVFFLWLGIAAGLVGLVLAVWPGIDWPQSFTPRSRLIADMTSPPRKPMTFATSAMPAACKGVNGVSQ